MPQLLTFWSHDFCSIKISLESQSIMKISAVLFTIIHNFFITSKWFWDGGRGPGKMYGWICSKYIACMDEIPKQ